MHHLPIVLLAHNIRSLWNIGALFRSADAFGIAHIYLTGYTSAPPRKEISKTALLSEQWIPWSKIPDPETVIQERKNQGFEILSLERASGSIDLKTYKQRPDTKGICLIVGHEILGVPDALLRASDHVVHIPMLGKKESLNVSVAAGIAMYCLMKLVAGK